MMKKASLAVALAALAAGCAPQPAPQTAALAPAPITRADILSAQTMLRSLGYRVGTPDGIAGPATTRAVGAFQTDSGLPATGVLDAATMVTLRARVDGQPVPAATVAAPARNAPSAGRPAPSSYDYDQRGGGGSSSGSGGSSGGGGGQSGGGGWSG